jgi:hypothetical protein
MSHTYFGRVSYSKVADLNKIDKDKLRFSCQIEGVGVEELSYNDNFQYLQENTTPCKWIQCLSKMLGLDPIQSKPNYIPLYFKMLGNKIEVKDHKINVTTNDQTQEFTFMIDYQTYDEHHQLVDTEIKII